MIGSLKILDSLKVSLPVREELLTSPDSLEPTILFKSGSSIELPEKAAVMTNTTTRRRLTDMPVIRMALQEK